MGQQTAGRDHASPAGFPAVGTGTEPHGARRQLPFRPSLSPCPISADVEWMALLSRQHRTGLGKQPGIGVHQQPLIFLSIFAASSLLHVRVREVCERKAGDVGGRDGEPGVGGRVGPALLCTPGRGRGRKVL